jgi:hypothetical protein
MVDATSEDGAFVRIDTHLPLHYQRLEPMACRREKARILMDRQARMNPFLQLMERWGSQEEQSARGAELERLVGPVLAIMNEKLDRILATLNPADPIALRFEEPRALNISGAGIRLTLPEGFPVDTVLALDFILPFPFPLHVKAIGRVHSIEPLDLEPQRWYTTLYFVVIHEEDREALIRYIFREQRIALRTRNISLPSSHLVTPGPIQDNCPESQSSL